MAEMRKTLPQVSAGGIVCRRTDGVRVEVAMIATHGGERWALPKGLVGRTETPEEAALREVREETGLSAEIVAPLEPIEYWYWGTAGARKVRFHKRVHYFVMRYVLGSVADHDDEVDDARWWPLEEAIELASYKSEKELLRGVGEVLGSKF